MINFRNILDPYRCTGLRLDQRIFNLLHIFIKTLCLHIDLLRAGNDKAASGIGVVDLKLLLDLGNAQPIADELVGIETDLIFLRRAAEALKSSLAHHWPFA